VSLWRCGRVSHVKRYKNIFKQLVAVTSLKKTFSSFLSLIDVIQIYFLLSKC